MLSKEEVEAEKATMRAIDARPIKKVAEAKQRKRKRLQVCIGDFPASPDAQRAALPGLSSGMGGLSWDVPLSWWHHVSLQLSALASISP